MSVPPRGVVAVASAVDGLHQAPPCGREAGEGHSALVLGHLPETELRLCGVVRTCELSLAGLDVRHDGQPGGGCALLERLRGELLEAVGQGPGDVLFEALLALLLGVVAAVIGDAGEQVGGRQRGMALAPVLLRCSTHPVLVDAVEVLEPLGLSVGVAVLGALGHGVTPSLVVTLRYV